VPGVVGNMFRISIESCFRGNSSREQHYLETRAIKYYLLSMAFGTVLESRHYLPFGGSDASMFLMIRSVRLNLFVMLGGKRYVCSCPLKVFF